MIHYYNAKHVMDYVIPVMVTPAIIVYLVIQVIIYKDHLVFYHVLEAFSVMSHKNYAKHAILTVIHVMEAFKRNAYLVVDKIIFIKVNAFQLVQVIISQTKIFANNVINHVKNVMVF